MSQYTTIRTEFNDPEILVNVLHEMGFPVETGHNLDLYDYLGVKRGKADLVIRRKHLGDVSNDLGFRRTGDVYKVVISDYDEAHLKKGNFLRELKQKYNVVKVKKETARQGLKLVREEVRADGTVELVVTT